MLLRKCLYGNTVEMSNCNRFIKFLNDLRTLKIQNSNFSAHNLKLLFGKFDEEKLKNLQDKIVKRYLR